MPLGLFGGAPEVNRRVFVQPGSTDLIEDRLEALPRGPRSAARDGSADELDRREETGHPACCKHRRERGDHVAGGHR